MKNPKLHPTVKLVKIERAGTIHRYQYENNDVTLRDEFAKQAMLLMGTQDIQDIPKKCYELADAMLEERLKYEDMK